MATDLSQEIPKFICKLCDIKTNNKKDFNKHILTLKHKKQTEINGLSTNFPKNTITTVESFICSNCNKQYKERSGLWRHIKNCKHENITIIEDNQIDVSTLDMNLIMQLLKQNDEFKALMVEQNNKMMESFQEVCKNNNTNITNTINSHNKTFNLQVFLNEQCKDAMNIMEFVDTIKLDLSDAESVRKLGYVNGISNIIIKHLKALDVHMRPVHCTDLKRETVYVKYQDVWEKEGDDNKLMRKAIKHVAVKNYNAADIFKELHPDCMNWDSKHGDHFSLLRIEALGGKGNINIYDSHTKIIKKIAKEITIDKSC
jgi:hypothetical protein